MKAFIDNNLIRKITSFGTGCGENLMPQGPEIEAVFCWPSLLENIGQGDLFDKFPKFDEQNSLFVFIISSLTTETEPDLLIRLYDQVFVECLTNVKALEPISPEFLLYHIRENLELNFSETNLFTTALRRYERLFVDDPHNTMHDLILYLAWDRVCVNMAIIFEHVFPDQKIPINMNVLRDCLIESFVHITAQGRTVPGFFRFVEALFAYQMREENLQGPTDEEWDILCQSARALEPRDELADIFYVDAAIDTATGLRRIYTDKEPIKVLTIDSAEKVNAGIMLARYTIGKLKKEFVNWPYDLRQAEIFCLKEDDSGLVLDTVIQSTSN